MRDRITAALTRRRFGGAVLLLAQEPSRRRLVGAGLLLAGIVLALIVLWPGGDDGDASKRRATKPLPVRIVSAPALGLAFVHPNAWTRTVQGQVFNLRSPDRSIQMLISSPVARPAQSEARRIATGALLAKFAPAKVVREGSRRLGGRPAASVELTGREDGKPVRALVVVASTDYRTYAVTLLSGANPSRRRLNEARRILGTVRFGKPTSASQTTTPPTTTTPPAPTTTAPAPGTP